MVVVSIFVVLNVGEALTAAVAVVVDDGCGLQLMLMLLY